jgi:ankyrin repeat protein
MFMTFEKVIKNFGNRALRLKDVQRYLDSGGDVHRRDDKMNWSLLHYAAEDCNPEVVQLLATSGADVNARDKNGWTPLHWAVESDMDAASQEGRRAKELPTVKALINHGADIAAKATDGSTPRDIAAAYGLEALYDSVAQPKDGQRKKSAPANSNHSFL